MAVVEVVERHPFVRDDGSVGEHRVFTGRREPQTLEDWIAMREAAMGGAARLPAGQVVLALLRAADERAAKAAVRAGAALDEWERHAVWTTLEVCRAGSRGFAPAAPVAERACAAWRAKWGDRKPRAVVLA